MQGLSTFSIKELQSFKTILKLVTRHGVLSNDQVYQHINDIINDRIAKSKSQGITSSNTYMPTSRFIVKKCPECTKKKFTHSSRPIDGINIWWCRSCGYSIIADDV